MPRKINKHLKAKLAKHKQETALGGPREELTKRVKTTENWYPTAKDGQYEVSFIRDGPKKWRVCAWGDDDMGLEKEYDDNQSTHHL